MSRRPCAVSPALTALLVLLLAPAAHAQLPGDPPAPVEAETTEPPELAATAPPPRTPPFGEAGQKVITGATDVSVGGSWWSNSNAGTTSFAADLGMDVFAFRGISFGGFVYYRGYTQRAYSVSTQAYGVTEVHGRDESIGLRIGFNVPFSRAVSWWIRPGLLIGTSETSVDGSSLSSSSHGFAFVLRAPILFHLAPHFFVGFGPDVRIDLTRTEDRTGSPVSENLYRSVNGSGTVGGWF